MKESTTIKSTSRFPTRSNDFTKSHKTEMRAKKVYAKTEILDAARVGLEFEFYSSMEVVETARDIAKYLKKRVVVPMAMSSIKEPKPLYHSPVQPSSTIFKLEPDYSGGKKMCELVTGPLDYSEARDVIIKVFEWIQSNGYTTERCSIHANISLDPNKIPTRVEIPMMNIVKFIMSFEESRVYEVFPKRKDSVYARSIKELHPNAIIFYTPKTDISRNVLEVPDEKYYGVNFLKAEKGYLEYRYMGGENYERKTKKILDLIDYFIENLYEVLNFDGNFNGEDKKFFKSLMERQQKLYEGFVKYSAFKKNFPKIEVGVDMRNDDQILETFWPVIKDQLYKILMTSGITKGTFNFDTDVSVLQIRNTKLKNVVARDVEIVDCEVEGVIERCTFYSSTIKNSRIVDCKPVKNNKFISCKIGETPLHITNVCDDCFIENKKFPINCAVNGGVIRNGEIGKLAKISSETMIVELIEPVESPGSYKDVEKGAKEEDKEKRKEKKDKK